MNNKPKVIIDTDPGHDDMLAICLLAKSDTVDIQALTTVAGNSSIENVTRNASYILDMLGRRDIPVYSGEEKPLARELIQAQVHGASGLAGADTSKTKYQLTNDAVDQIIYLVKNNPGEITLVTIGPQSNVARAFLKDPQLSMLIKQLVIMGGAINVPGNKNRVAEFNMFVDPEAADVVFRADVKKILIPLDVCNNMPLFLADFERLKGLTLYEPIMEMMKHFIRGIAKYEGTQGALVYDAIAAYYLVRPEAFIIESMDIVIETKGEYTFGMTVAEKRTGETKKENVEVVTRVNRELFVTDFIDILKT